MDHLQDKETTCKHCNEVFPSKGKYQYHFQRVHQREVTIHHSDQEGTSIGRSENAKFVCICDKGYHVGQSLHRHQKSCRQWKDHQSSLDPDFDSEISVQGNIHKCWVTSNL